jgi:hypothetical protein
MFDIDKILGRIKKIKKIHKQKEIAKLFKLSDNDFSNRKKRGTLIPVIIEWAMKEKVSIDWLLDNRKNTPFDEEIEEDLEKKYSNKDIKKIENVVKQLAYDNQLLKSAVSNLAKNFNKKNIIKK